MFKKRHKNLTEPEIIERAKSDQYFFGLLYERYFEQLYRFTFKRLGGDEELAGDLTQQTFLKAMANMHQYQDRGFPFSSWLFRIAQNEINMHFRSAKKMVSVQVEQTAAMHLMDDVVSSEVSLKEKDLEKLISLLNSLTAEQCDLIELRYFQHVSFKEIAEMYSITEANAKMKVYRILEKLKVKWELEQ